MPAMWSSAWGHCATSEPWKSWMVSPRPAALLRGGDHVAESRSSNARALALACLVVGHSQPGRLSTYLWTMEKRAAVESSRCVITATRWPKVKMARWKKRAATHVLQPPAVPDHDRAHAARALALGLELLVQQELRLVEHEGLDTPGFRADAQTGLGEPGQIA